MANKIDFTNAFALEIRELQDRIKWTKEQIANNDLPSAILSGVISATNIEVLKTFCEKHISGPNKEDLAQKLEKLESKLVFSLGVIDYLQEDSEAMDPRIAKVFVKIQKIQDIAGKTQEVDVIKIHHKLEEYSNFISRISTHCNAKTLQVAGASNRMIDQLQEQISVIPQNEQHADYQQYNWSDEETAPAPTREIQWDYSDDDTGPGFDPGTTTTTTADRDKFTCEQLKAIFAPIPHQTPTFEQIMPPGLLTVVEKLSLKTEDGFFEALDGLESLRETFECTFAMSNNDVLSIRKRIFFHMYHIHDKETPSVVDRNDHDYGLTVFQDEQRSTPEQKLRAAQRTLLEVCLFAIEKANCDDNVHVLPIFLEGLEKVVLDPIDSPSGKTNVAHALFGKLYTIYSEVQKADPSLEHPHSRKFKGDFGRHAFCGTAEVAIPNEYKLQALREVIAEIKAVWKI